MRKFVQLALVFGLAVSLLNAGDCGSPFFASKETRDCCNRGKCAPSNRSDDDCCKVSNAWASTAIVISGKASFPNPLSHIDSAAMTAVATQVHPMLTLSSLLRADHTLAWATASFGRIDLPLLI